VIVRATTQFLYDGVQAIGEYDASNALLRGYVPGPRAKARKSRIDRLRDRASMKRWSGSEADQQMIR